MVRRTDFSIVELVKLSVDAEQMVDNSKMFMPLPLPAAALLPKMEY